MIESGGDGMDRRTGEVDVGADRGATTASRMIRATIAVVVGIVVWFVVATLGNGLVRAFVPGYTDVEAAMLFTLPMLVARLAVGVASSISAGAVCARISVPRAPRVLAGAMVLLFLPVHVGLWDRFPLWYHAVFLLSLAPVVLAGAALARREAPGMSADRR